MELLINLSVMRFSSIFLNSLTLSNNSIDGLQADNWREECGQIRHKRHVYHTKEICNPKWTSEV